MYPKLSEQEEYLAKQVVDIAFKVHKSLGPGLLESVYAKYFRYELFMSGINYVQQQEVPVVYNSKTQENFHPVWEAQILRYFKLTNKRLEFLINFHVTLIKDGIKRMIL